MAVTKGTRSWTKRWIIRCKNGSLETYPMRRHDAEVISRELDEIYRECRPHMIDEEGKNDGLPLRSL